MKNLDSSPFSQLHSFSVFLNGAKRNEESGFFPFLSLRVRGSERELPAAHRNKW